LLVNSEFKSVCGAVAAYHGMGTNQWRKVPPFWVFGVRGREVFKLDEEFQSTFTEESVIQHGQYFIFTLWKGPRLESFGPSIVTEEVQVVRMLLMNLVRIQISHRVNLRSSPGFNNFEGSYPIEV
jgi:hypothetical protein